MPARPGLRLTFSCSPPRAGTRRRERAARRRLASALGLTRPRRRLVGLPRGPSQGEDRDSLAAGNYLAALLRTNPDERARLELPALPAGLQARTSPQHHIDFLLAIARVIVVGVTGPA